MKGLAKVYRPKLSGMECLARAIESTLAGASAEARQAVLARLIGDLGTAEIEELRRLAAEAARRRR